VYPRSNGERDVSHGQPGYAQEAIGGIEPVDDPDEPTFPEPAEPEDEPTTIRPSPLPAILEPRLEASIARKPGRGFAASLRGRVGKYELRDKLGRGAFGVVFTARDPSLDRDVAIKVLRPTHLTNPEIVQRFLQEARATARISHPGIVTIHDCGRVETGSASTAFIAMELLSGESLTTRLVRCGRLPPDAAAEIARQVASALEAAHRANVLHRDLKPDNIYVVPDPAMPTGERVKVLDFGLAKLGDDGHTQLQTVFGTPRYMSPEQCRSATQVDHRSDIYALGCILFELVTGHLPFDGDVRQLIQSHQHAPPPRATSYVPELSPALDDLIDDMLSKAPMDRPQTMGAVQRALQHAINADITVLDPGPQQGEIWALGAEPTASDAPATREPSQLGDPSPLSLPDGAASRAAEPEGPALRPDDAPTTPEGSRLTEHPRPPRGATDPLAGSHTSIAARLALADTTETPHACDPGALSGELLVPAGEIADAPPSAATAVRTPDRRVRFAWLGGLVLLAVALVIAIIAAA
jgi:serine/threonine protein kinase